VASVGVDGHSWLIGFDLQIDLLKFASCAQVRRHFSHHFFEFLLVNTEAVGPEDSEEVRDAHLVFLVDEGLKEMDEVDVQLVNVVLFGELGGYFVDDLDEEGEGGGQQLIKVCCLLLLAEETG
jgi:hypothetical protein